MPLESFEGTLAQRVVAPPRIGADVRLRARSHFVDTMERVCIHIDPTLPRAATGVTHCTRVQLTSRNGACVQRSHSVPFGSAERPCSKDQLQRKFLDCVAYGLDAQAALQIWAGIDAISERDPASDLLEVVRGSAEQRP